VGLWKVDLSSTMLQIAPKGVEPGGKFVLPGQFSQV